jgi:hypothetical protein
MFEKTRTGDLPSWSEVMSLLERMKLDPNAVSKIELLPRSDGVRVHTYRKNEQGELHVIGGPGDAPGSHVKGDVVGELATRVFTFAYGS